MKSFSELQSKYLLSDLKFLLRSLKKFAKLPSIMSKKTYRILFAYNRKCSVRKDVLRNFAKFTRKHL